MRRTDMLPRNVADMIEVVRNRDERMYHRENVAAMLEAIVREAQAALQSMNSERRTR